MIPIHCIFLDGGIASLFICFLLRCDPTRAVASTFRWFIIIIIFIYLFTAIGLLPGGSGYFTYIQNMKLVTNKLKPGGLHEKHVVATWNVGNRLSICL